MKNIKLFVCALICLFALVAFTACSQTASKIDVKVNADGETLNENDKEEVLPDEEINDEIDDEIDDEVDEEEPIVDELQEFVNKVLEVKGVKGKLGEEELKELAQSVLELELDEEKAILVVASVVLNPTLTVEDVKDLDVKVLKALCDKLDKSSELNYNQYKKALKELKEKYAYIEELEDQVYDYLYKLLEDLSDEEFDQIAIALKEAKQALKEAEELFAAEKEALDVLFADVLKNHKTNGHGHHGGKNWSFEYDYEFGCYEFDEDEFEKYFEDYSNEIEKYFEEFGKSFEFNFGDFFNNFEGFDFDEEQDGSVYADSYFFKW